MRRLALAPHPKERLVLAPHHKQTGSYRPFATQKQNGGKPPVFAVPVPPLVDTRLKADRQVSGRKATRRQPPQILAIMYFANTLNLIWVNMLSESMI
jgi:hypothetical protein